MWAERIEKQAKGFLDKKITLESCWSLVMKEAEKTKLAEKAAIGTVGGVNLMDSLGGLMGIFAIY